jgi:hypothetical protein
MLDLNKELVNLGYPTNEPSLSKIILAYYVANFDLLEAIELANQYCEQINKLQKEG